MIAGQFHHQTSNGWCSPSPLQSGRGCHPRCERAPPDGEGGRFYTKEFAHYRYARAPEIQSCALCTHFDDVASCALVGMVRAVDPRHFERDPAKSLADARDGLGARLIPPDEDTLGLTRQDPRA